MQQLAEPQALLPAGDLEKANKATWLFVKIVVFNFVLYVAVAQLSLNGVIDRGSIWPSLLSFLSFALSVGILLIVGLGERIETGNIKNEWLRKIGVTRTMIIVAVLASLLASFTPLAALILPAPMTYMLVRAGITCFAADKNSFPEATSLLTVITSPEVKTIQDVDDFLHGQAQNVPEKAFRAIRALLIKEEPKFDLNFVNKNKDDENYNMLLKFASTNRLGAEGLLGELEDNTKWIAYTVPVSAPSHKTPIPIPTLYNLYHSTHFFLITSDQQPNPQSTEPWLASLNASVARASNPPRKDLLPLLKAEIEPRGPKGSSSETELSLRMFYNDAQHVCWHITTQ
jgi:hypothetical protein